MTCALREVSGEPPHKCRLRFVRLRFVVFRPPAVPVQPRNLGNLGPTRADDAASACVCMSVCACVRESKCIFSLNTFKALVCISVSIVCKDSVYMSSPLHEKFPLLSTVKTDTLNIYVKKIKKCILSTQCVHARVCVHICVCCVRARPCVRVCLVFFCPRMCAYLLHVVPFITVTIELTQFPEQFFLDDAYARSSNP